MEITLLSLSDYSNGRLISKTFGLDDLSKDEYKSEVREWLDSISNDGIIREECVVQGSCDIPGNFVGMFDLDSDFWEFKEQVEILAQRGFDWDVAVEALTKFYKNTREFDAYRFTGSYIGEYNSPEDFAREYCSELLEIPEHLELYIDWEKYARDLLINDYWELDGHYFRNI